MKKFSLTILTCLAVGIGMYSCKKESIDPVDSSKVSTEEQLMTARTEEIELTANGDFLIFGQVADYEYYASADFTYEEFETFYTQLSNMDFISQSKNIELGGSDIFEIDFLNHILSVDQTVQIGDNIYKLNEEDELVYVLPASEIAAYQDLVNEDVSNTNIKLFSYEDDVLELVELGDEGISKGLFCKEAKAAKKIAHSPVLTIIEGEPQIDEVTTSLFVQYKRSGIHHVLRAVGGISLSAIDNYPAGTFKSWFQLDNCSYDVRCSSDDVSNYDHPWRSAQSTNRLQSTGLYRYELKFYRWTKKLKNYDFKVRLRTESTLQATPPNNYTIYFTEYAQITS